jgi:hypothetical protein
MAKDSSATSAVARMGNQSGRSSKPNRLPKAVVLLPNGRTMPRNGCIAKNMDLPAEGASPREPVFVNR